MSRPKYVASCSGGKDSVATLLLAAQRNEPLDEAVFSEVMFDKDTSGEVPEHRDFIYDRLKPFCEKELGIKFTIQYVRSYVENAGVAIYDTIPKKPAARESIRDKLKSAQKAQPPHTPKPQKSKGKDMVL